MRKEWFVDEGLMDEIEKEVLYATLKNKSIVVSGSAGSGKSLIAVTLAKRVEENQLGGRMIVVYTKALEEYIREGIKTLNFNCNLTHHELWKWRNVEKWDNNDNRYYEKELYCPHADYFVVDEIQDFSLEDIRLFVSSTDKFCCFFGDMAQSVYQRGRITMKQVLDLIPASKNPKDYTLYYNYRLPIGIAKAAQYVGENLEPFEEGRYKSKEKTIPRVIKMDNKDDQIKEISEYCKRHINSETAILVPYKLDVINVCTKLKELGVNCEMKYDVPDPFKEAARRGQRINGIPDEQYRDVDTLDFSTNNVKVLTYHSSKGLQFQTVFLPWINQNPQYATEMRTPLYVAMTRTYRDLFILHQGYLPYPLSSIPRELYKTTIIDKVEDK